MSGRALIKRMIPAVFCTFAFMTSFIFGFWCESVQFNPIDSETNPVLRFGPWYRQITVLQAETIGNQTNVYVDQGCAAYPEGINFDSKWKAARAFTVITALLGGLMCVFLWVAMCSDFMSPSSWKHLAVFSIVDMTLFQGLTFLILRSSACDGIDLKNASNYSGGCEWDDGSTANVVSIVLWFLTGLVMMVVGAPGTSMEDSSPEQMEVVDGSADDK